MKKILIPAILLTVAGCAWSIYRQEIATFQCGTETIKVKLLDKNDAVLTYKGEKHILHRQNGSNTYYENIGKSIAFWKEDGKNYFKNRQIIFPTCELVDVIQVEVEEKEVYKPFSN